MCAINFFKLSKVYGHYHETWVQSAEGWRIARLQLRRTILEITPQ
jgi:hypothetical protein